MSASTCCARPERRRPRHPTAPLTTDSLRRYGALGLPLALPTVAVYVLLPTWYFETTGLSLTLIGALLLFTRLFDVVTDPLIGLAIDRYPAIRPARPILIGGLLCAPALWLLVNPLADQAALSLLAGLLLLYLGWTLIQVPYLAWLPRLHDDSHERNRAAGFREAMTLAGLVLSAALPAAASLAGFDVQQGLNLLVLVTLLIGAFAVRALGQLPAGRLPSQASSDGGWRLFRENRLALRLLTGWFVNGLANGFPAILFPLFVSAWLGAANWTAPCTSCCTSVPPSCRCRCGSRFRVALPAPACGAWRCSAPSPPLPWRRC
ncbi:MFS transporter [Marinobacterium aestuariivivens]|uniref:MFS transporter n=1 Tax=Marinobacterium aestuariivivens TaxID=1698799 RepID=A0ABW1ZUX3_9GAMM